MGAIDLHDDLHGYDHKIYVTSIGAKPRYPQGSHGRLHPARALGLHFQLPARTVHRRLLKRCEEVMRAVCADFETELVEFNGERDHVHLLVHYPPKVAISRLVASLKAVSARGLRQEFPGHIRRYLWGDHFWSPSYFAASCGGAPLAVVEEYIANQRRPD